MWGLVLAVGLFLATIAARGVFRTPFMRRLQVKPKTLEERGGLEPWLLANKEKALGLVGKAITLGMGLALLSPVPVGWEANPSDNAGFLYEVPLLGALLNLSIPPLPTPVLSSGALSIWFLFSGIAGYAVWLRRHKENREARQFQFVSPDFMTRLPGVRPIVGLFSDLAFIAVIKLAFSSIDCSQSDNGTRLVLDADLEICF